MLTDERKNELRENYFRVLERIEAAKKKRGDDAPVTLLAASKTMPAEETVFLARECGLGLCGENHAQEFRDKYADVTAAGCRMDFIGHLQKNKVKYVVGKAGLIHSVDSLEIAEEINRQAARLGIVQPVLIEVNIGGEESKTGISSSLLSEMYEKMSDFHSLKLRGMMAMTPKCEKNEENRKYFRKSYGIFLDIFVKKSHNIEESILSLGMSDSFEVAIEEGATLVRVGTSIFGRRDYGAKLSE